MSKARIYKPAKSAMQSGEARSKHWVLEFEPTAAERPEALMGWVSSSDTQRQVRLEFETLDEAVAYATREGIAYSIFEPKPRTPVQKSYADNFKFGRTRSWTH